MKCPHCRTDFHDQKNTVDLGRDIDGLWSLEKRACPACHRLIFTLISYNAKKFGEHYIPDGESSRALVRPKISLRPPIPSEVPEEFASDYREAAAILSESPKASAALSRRCLQHLIREKAGIKKKDLAQEIDELISSNNLPSYLSDAVDAVRNIGNFAAHPVKAVASGEVLPVEPGEAEWTLDVLDGLFDFYFVQPSLLKARRDALNQKLTAANKPNLK